jgi:hypothetical protein
MSTQFTPPSDEPHKPTQAELRFAQSMKFLSDMLLQGELGGMAVAAINSDGDHSCLYINSAQADVLGPPMEQLRVMYETNRSFRKMDTSPANNKSFRTH